VENFVFRLQPKDYHTKYPKWPGMVGLEIEMLVFWKKDEQSFKPSVVPLWNGDSGSISDILVDSAKSYGGNPIFEEFEGRKRLSAVKLSEQDNITFEPGCQVEFSSIPYPCLSEAISRLESVQGMLDEAFLARGVGFIQAGINPWQTVDEISLQMKKPRYVAMDQYFTNIGEFGRRMMRQTCGFQVNLDFGEDEETLAKRYLVANLLAPIGTAVFAYSPVVDRALTDRLSYRAHVWQKLDNTRTGIPKLNDLVKDLTKAHCVNAYLDDVLHARVVFVQSLNCEVPEKPMTFLEWMRVGYKGIKPTTQDFETHMSLHFPEVRARGFLEMRSIDCQSRLWQSVPAAFYTALLYDEKTLEKVYQLLLPTVAHVEANLTKSCYGLRDENLKSLCQKVMNLACEGFTSLPSCFQGEGTVARLHAFREMFTNRGRTPADDVVDLLMENGTTILSPALLYKLEQKWANKADKKG
jgi:glutamate--cysteine ligase